MNPAKKIVVIDDNGTNIHLIRVILEKSHPQCMIFTAQSGLEGIEIVEREKPDTILLDIFMPAMNGHQTCKKIKENPDTQHIPILMISAGAQNTETRLEGLRAGADAIVSKPFDRAEFIALVNVMLRIKETEETLIRKNRELEDYQSRLKKLNVDLLSAEEKERRRIAGYLHDGIAQNLSLANMKLTSLPSTELSPKINKVIQESASLINNAISETRILTYDLSPPILYELGLVAAIEWKLGQIEKKYGILTAINSPVDSLKISSELRILLYRIIVELLNNVIKHANADLIQIEISTKQKQLYISVADNGKGFNVQNGTQLTNRGGFGLFNVKERLDSIRGSLYFEPNVVFGTKAIIQIPL